MPSLSKKSLSLFLRNDCERQFVLSLYNDDERRRLSLPPRDQSRFALGLAGRAGYEWQAEKVSELQDVFGAENVHSQPAGKHNRPAATLLSKNLLAKLKPYQFVVEAAYPSDTATFRSAIGLNDLKDYFGSLIGLNETHPDIIQVLPPSFDQYSDNISERDLYKLQVNPKGELSPILVNDQRLRLRVIDIKLTSEPGAYYFAEVVYYSMTLAAWLIDNKFDDRFVVIGAAAVWPGSHDASKLATQMETWTRTGHDPSSAEMAIALERDLEIASFEVYALRLRQFLSEEFPRLIQKPWQELSWYVDFRCKGCEFLGYPWKDKDGNLKNDPSQCWPSAHAKDHLSQVVGLTRGGSQQLCTEAITNVATLAATSAASHVFDQHQGLRAKRSTFPHRAKALLKNASSVIPYSGGDALMPRWPDLHIYVFLDYDLSSAITASIATSAFWIEPLPRNSSLKRNQARWPDPNDGTRANEVFLIDRRSLERERDEFLKFLRHLRHILKTVVRQDLEDNQNNRRDARSVNSTYQIYLWDESQRKHLTRLVGRHLPYVLADSELRDLAWLFPPPELLQHPEDATRQSPITLVSPVIDNTIALRISHYHGLLNVAQSYRPNGKNAPSVHPLYEEPMSDLIPAERIHEWWARIGTWHEKQRIIQETASKKVWALRLVVRRLEQDLKGVLSRHAAPTLTRPRRVASRISPHGRLWVEYTRLNTSLDEFEAQAICAMPPHEREARLKSARLRSRLSGQEELDALAALRKISENTLIPSSSLFVYKMREASRDINARPGDFTYALSPEKEYGFLDCHPYPIIKGTPLEQRVFANSVARAGMTSVSIEAIDRIQGLIALHASQNCCIRELEQFTQLDFSRNVVLDPVPVDFLTDKVALTVRGIGYPSTAIADARVLQAMGITGSLAANSPTSPGAEVLWEAPKLHNSLTDVELNSVRQQLEPHLVSTQENLDVSQWRAWAEALSRRLSLIWGPPGTGKSRTLRALILGAVVDAIAKGRPHTLLATASTYTAIDNVLLMVQNELTDFLPPNSCEVIRVQSKWRPLSTSLKDTPIQNLILDVTTPSPEIKRLKKKLDEASGISIVGCTPQQLHNLAIIGKSKSRRHPQDTIRSWFDLIIIDEATQMDIAQSTLVFTKLKEQGVCVLAGDDLQLPPIQKADPPEDLGYVVGSTYNYFRRHHGIAPNALDVNYRSNRTLVEFTKIAGYSESLKSNSPDLQLHLISDSETKRPSDWPSQLYWCADWEKLLDPAFPCVCFTYDDRTSSQINDFEAGAVGSLIWSLQSRMADRPRNERRFDGSFDTQDQESYLDLRTSGIKALEL